MPDFHPIASGDDPAEHALRAGLYAQPVPNVSPDFNDRVLAALRRPAPWWQLWWQSARPVAISAAGSLCLTLVLLHWSLNAPLPPPSRVPATSVASRSATMPSLDALLNRPNLCAASLEWDWNAPLPVSPPALPHRHSELLPKELVPCLPPSRAASCSA